MKAMKLTGLRRMEMQDVPAPAARRATPMFWSRWPASASAAPMCITSPRAASAASASSIPGRSGTKARASSSEVGAAVTRVKPGDRIAFDPAQPCGECDQCLAGRPHTCRAQKFLGCPGQIEGCLAEYLVMPERSCYPIPDTMTFDEAAIVEPLSIGVYALTLSVPMPGATVGILGAGPIGLSVLLPAKAQGAGRVYMTDKIDARLQMASRAGADWVGNPDTEDVVAADHARASRNCWMSSSNAAASRRRWTRASRLLKPGGKLLLIGIPGARNRVSFDINLLRRKEICIQNVRRQNNCVQRAIDMIANKEIDVNVMVTHHFPFAQTQEGFDMVADYRDGVVKAMVTFE